MAVRRLEEPAHRRAAVHKRVAAAAPGVGAQKMGHCHRFPCSPGCWLDFEPQERTTAIERQIHHKLAAAAAEVEAVHRIAAVERLVALQALGTPKDRQVVWRMDPSNSPRMEQVHSLGVKQRQKS